MYKCILYIVIYIYIICISLSVYVLLCKFMSVCLFMFVVYITIITNINYTCIYILYVCYLQCLWELITYYVFVS